MSEQTSKRIRRWVDFDALKEKAQFVPVLEHYGITCKRRGSELLGCCPFHEDEKPSLSVNVEKGVFHCFGCKESGDVLNFVARKEGIGIRKAASVLAEICGIELPTCERGEDPADQHVKPDATPDSSPSESQAPSESDTGDVNPPLTFELKLDTEHQYMEQRGLTPETVQHFGLGYCSRGLLKGRIAIPIHDADGNLVAYAGRWIGDLDAESEKEGKYKLPPKFRKSLVVFNLHRVPEDCRTVIVVEGYFATFWLYQHGYRNVVALMGTSLSPTQLDLLSRRFEHVHLLFDGDEAGRTESEAVTLQLCGNVNVKCSTCPERLQPDDLSSDELVGVIGSPTV